MKLKKILFMSAAVLALTACSGNNTNTSLTTSGDNTPNQTTNNDNLDPTTNTNTGTNTDNKVYNKSTTIYLAGDSTVKTYNDQQYIGGWGQYLGSFLDSKVTVKNCAQGGRSSRSFINEGRLFDTKENGFSYTFTENEGKSIESCIKADDFLFIQFGHNDDDTKSYTDTTYQYERFVPLGTKDASGKYPTIKPTKTSTATKPADMKQATKDALDKYGANYYAYDSTGATGTYKGYLKEYIDFAREKGATPVLVTPVSRVKFSGNEIVGGPGLHGENFAYVEAVRQLATEEDCLLIDLFSYTKNLLETATPSYANYVMALKPNSLTGEWPTGYDTTYNNTALGYEGIEATHYNKYGAYLTAAKVAEIIKGSTDTHKEEKEYFSFKELVKDAPTEYVSPSNLITKAKISEIEATIKTINVTDPNRTYPTNDALVAKLAEIPEVANINATNYQAVAQLLEEAKVLYSALNVDDRKAEFKTKIDATENKVQEIIIELRPKATSTVSVDFSTVATVADTPTTFTVSDEGGKFSISSKCLKLGANGSTAAEYISTSVNGKGKVLVSIKAYSGNIEKACLLAVSNGTTEKKESLTEGSAKTFEFEYDIDGNTTFYIYRATGSGTGVMVSSITVEYFEKN